MKLYRFFLLSTLWVSLAGCGNGDGKTSTYNGGTQTGGSTSSSGGSTASGGVAAMGGNSTGGTTSSGGTTLAGGSTATGGTKASGGVMDSGGITMTSGIAASGGTVSSGGAASSGGANDGGSTATGGKPSTGGVTSSGGAQSGGTTRIAGCPEVKLEGFASLPYDGVSTTTGGGNATPDAPSTTAELAKLAGDATPRVIHIKNSMTIGLLKVTSNKTLIGIGPNVVLTGGISIMGTREPRVYVSNIIVRNLTVKGEGWHGDPPVGVTAGDAFQTMYAHHVWVDHCNIYDGPDGNLDVTRGSDFVTISWCKFWYTQEEHKHRLSSLVSGGSDDDNGLTDTGHLNTTWHHNWWAELVHERMPRYLWGKGHIYNNYYSSAGNNYCTRVGSGAGVLIENNYYQNIREPYAFLGDSANIRAEGNIEVNVKPANKASGARGNAEPFPNPAPYAYTADPAEIIPELLKKCSGPH